MNQAQLQMPPRHTLQELTSKVVRESEDLGFILSILGDLSTKGVASEHFQEGILFFFFWGKANSAARVLGMNVRQVSFDLLLNGMQSESFSSFLLFYNAFSSFGGGQIRSETELFFDLISGFLP